MQWVSLIGVILASHYRLAGKLDTHIAITELELKNLKEKIND